MAKKKKVIKKTVITEEIITDEKTHIICILDSSYSMKGIMEESIIGFNMFLKEQKERVDEATITVALFDSWNNYDLVYDNVNIKEAAELTSEEWHPRGMTALYDAIGKTVTTDRTAIKKMSKTERPDKVLVCIVTDGHENDSKEYTKEGVKNLIKDCEKDDWNFMYLAANQDAFAVGSSFGVSKGNTHTYNASKRGVGNMSAKLSTATSYYRNATADSVEFNSISKNLLADENENDELTTDDSTNE